MLVLVRLLTPEHMTEPNHALLEVTPGLVRDIAKKMGLAKRLHAEDHYFLGLKYVDYTPEFIDLDSDAYSEMEQGYDGSAEDMDNELDAGPIILPRKFDGTYEIGMRPVTLFVSDDDFHWAAYHKHGGSESRVETYTISESALRSWAGKLNVEVRQWLMPK